MSNLQSTLGDLLKNLSEKNYDESLAQYCFWSNIGSAHGHISRYNVGDSLWQIAQPSTLNHPKEVIHPTVHLLIRFIKGMEADQKLSRYTIGLHERRCASGLYAFFEDNISLVRAEQSYGNRTSTFLTNVNLIAHWANLGYVAEEIIRGQILQSLISYPKLYSHQADALIILFKLAGATFEAYADPPVVNRCFESLRGRNSRDPAREKLIQVRVSPFMKGLSG